MAVKGKQPSSTCQIEGKQVGAWGVQRDVVHKTGIAIRIVEGGKEPVVDNPQPVVLVEESLLIRGSDLHVVDTLHVRKVRPKPSICEGSILSHCLLLNRGKVVEKIGTWVVVVVVAPDKAPRVKTEL